MATTKRHINFTGRKRIRHDAVDIRLLEGAPDGILKATASINLVGLDFPPSAGVAIEAYHSSSTMRFDCGTVGQLRIPPAMALDEIDVGGTIQFRVKVVDRDGVNGRLLGSVERIRARSGEDDDGRRSIFPIYYRNIGDQIWYVDVDEDTPPSLVLNSRITTFPTRMLSDELLRGVMMPMALRIVLEKLASFTSIDAEDEADWKAEWLRFCHDELGIESDLDGLSAEERAEWVDEVVLAFCRQNLFVDRIRKAAEGVH